MGKFFEDLRDGLEEAIAHEKGKKTLRTRLLQLPEPPEHYKAKDIKKIRSKWQYSQGVFAIILNVSVKTVRSWESGERSPSHAALRLLEIVDHGIYNPKIFRKQART
ncbi:MAG: helix-turn-helix domain-containing protein [Chlamydiales bacterium]